MRLTRNYIGVFIHVMTDEIHRLSALGHVLTHVPDPEVEPLMRVPAAAALVGISPRAGYQAVERGEWPALRTGRAVRIPTREFLLKYGLLREPA